MKKIDKSIFNEVSSMSSDKKKIECVIYLRNFKKNKNFFYSLAKGSDIIEFPFIAALGLSLPPSEIFRLERLESIKYITASAKASCQTYIAKNVMNYTLFEEELSLDSGANIAVIDTGIAPHIDFLVPENKILYFKDFINDLVTPYDDNGHGTFVSGILAGSGVASLGKYVGFSPNSKIISLKALDKNGETSTFNILKAMQWIHNNHEEYEIKTVCLSLGSIPSEKNDPLSIGAQSLWKKGMVVVAAAGNNGPESETIRSPAINPSIISVGAMNDGRLEYNVKKENFKVAEFSSRGPAFGENKPDLITSGVEIVSTNFSGKNFYVKMSGTSMSAPIIAGIAARIVKKYPLATPDRIKRFLKNNCSKLNADINSEGNGYINFD